MALDRTVMDELAVAHQLEQAGSRRSNAYLRVSGIGECRRKLAYRILWAREGRPEPRIWTHGLAVFDIGHAVHLQIHQRLSNVGMGWVDAEPALDAEGRLGFAGNCEVSVVDDASRLRGTLDDLSRPLKRLPNDGAFETLGVTDEEDPEGRRYVIDIKTVTARDRLQIETDDFGRVMRAEAKPSTFERLEAAKPEHLQQAGMYAWLTTQPEFRTDRIPGPLPRIPDLMILYVAKDLDPEYYGRHPLAFPEPRGLLNSPYKVFTQPVNPRSVTAMRKKAALVWSCIDEGTLPGRDYHHSHLRPDWHCTDCPFRRACYQEEGYFAAEEDVDPPQLLQKLSGKEETRDAGLHHDRGRGAGVRALPAAGDQP